MMNYDLFTSNVAIHTMQYRQVQGLCLGMHSKSLIRSFSCLVTNQLIKKFHNNMLIFQAKKTTFPSSPIDSKLLKVYLLKVMGVFQG